MQPSIFLKIIPRPLKVTLKVKFDYNGTCLSFCPEGKKIKPKIYGYIIKVDLI